MRVRSTVEKQTPVNVPLSGSWRVEPNSIRASGNSCHDANEGQSNDACRFQRLEYPVALETTSLVPSPHIIEIEQTFRQFLAQNKDKTQKQIAELWGEGLTQQNVSYVLKKLGITRKKKLTVTLKEMKRSEKNSKED